MATVLVPTSGRRSLSIWFCAVFGLVELRVKLPGFDPRLLAQPTFGGGNVALGLLIFGVAALRRGPSDDLPGVVERCHPVALGHRGVCARQPARMDDSDAHDRPCAAAARRTARLKNSVGVGGAEGQGHFFGSLLRATSQVVYAVRQLLPREPCGGLPAGCRTKYPYPGDLVRPQVPAGLGPVRAIMRVS